MFVAQNRWTAATGWIDTNPVAAPLPSAQLVMFFGAREAIADCANHQALRTMYPDAHLLGCTTAGEICGTTVSDDSVVATAIRFDHTSVRAAYRPLVNASNSKAVGEEIARDLAGENLLHVFVLAEGLKVNGSELVKGLRQRAAEWRRRNRRPGGGRGAVREDRRVSGRTDKRQRGRCDRVLW